MALSTLTSTCPLRSKTGVHFSSSYILTRLFRAVNSVINGCSTLPIGTSNLPRPSWRGRSLYSQKGDPNCPYSSPDSSPGSGTHPAIRQNKHATMQRNRSSSTYTTIEHIDTRTRQAALAMLPTHGCNPQLRQSYVCGPCVLYFVDYRCRSSCRVEGKSRTVSTKEYNFVSRTSLLPKWDTESPC